MTSREYIHILENELLKAYRDKPEINPSKEVLDRFLSMGVRTREIVAMVAKASPEDFNELFPKMKNPALIECLFKCPDMNRSQVALCLRALSKSYRNLYGNQIKAKINPDDIFCLPIGMQYNVLYNLQTVCKSRWYTTGNTTTYPFTSRIPLDLIKEKMFIFLASEKAVQIRARYGYRRDEGSWKQMIVEDVMAGWKVFDDRAPADLPIYVPSLAAPVKVKKVRIKKRTNKQNLFPLESK